MSACANLTACEKFFAIVVRGSVKLSEGDFKSAEGLFRVALALAQSAPPELARDLTPLALCHLSLLLQRQNRTEESQRLREQATAALDSHAPSPQSALFQVLMADVLMGLGEYRRAIPFFEQAIAMERECNDPVVTAGWLLHAGECYDRSGLKDHAAVPLRAAVKIFRNYPGDPRLASALLTLGNALRKSAPAEAEACYRESADWHVARAQLLSASPAWSNLGIICSEQGRHAEALELYEKVLRVREQSPGTPPARLAAVLNNIACCYRRMGRFAEAHASVDRAIDLAKPGGSHLASAYGTRGEIFRDEGRDAEAVDWLRMGYEEHRKAPSPNLKSIADNLEDQIAALKRLGRLEEVATAEEKLGALRAAMKAVPQADRNLSALDRPTQGAVLVELSFGSQMGSQYTKFESVKLAHQLSDTVETQNAGWYGGTVASPESTTLMFYGADAEALFRVLEPSLTSEPMCAGAMVTIRRPEGHREVVLPSRTM
jgi:tetratricopeptide (TPR) repeat protein